MSRIAFASILVLTLGACSTFAPVATGKDSYLIEGGVGLVPPSFTTMANLANEFCEAKRLKMTVLQWSVWIPGRETPKLQFSCTTEASPVHLRPDLGVKN